ncbi:MAG: hypothetical protein LBH41_00295, partial [Rickettsiales bacterium]|nr:hypothetical protein [Rickettsiales bacterium]
MSPVFKFVMANPNTKLFDLQAKTHCSGNFSPAGIQRPRRTRDFLHPWSRPPVDNFITANNKAVKHPAAFPPPIVKYQSVPPVCLFNSVYLISPKISDSTKIKIKTVKIRRKRKGRKFPAVCLFNKVKNFRQHNKSKEPKNFRRR